MTTAADAFPPEAGTFLRNRPEMDLKGQRDVPLPPAMAAVPCADADQMLQADAIGSALARQLSEWERFCILAFQIDSPTATETTHSLDQGVLQVIGQPPEALTVQLKPGLYGCAIPDDDTDQARRLALRFQRELTENRLGSFSVGIAPYPLLDFSRGQIIFNSVKALDHAAFLGPGSSVVFDAVTLNISGDKYYQSGELDACMAEYRAALILDPDNTNVLNSLGVCLARINDLQAAKATFQAVIRKNPAEAMAVYNLGMVCRLEGHADSALSYFNQALELDSDAFEIAFQTARLLTEQSRWEEALQILERASAAGHEQWQLLGLRGKCLTVLGRTRAALQAYTRAVKINPNDAEIVSALGYLYDRHNENPEICETFLLQGIALDPENGQLHHRLGCWYQKHGQPERALAAFEQAARLGCTISRGLISSLDF
jgi:tetratricopeptide (TPR) repeat protein